MSAYWSSSRPGLLQGLAEHSVLGPKSVVLGLEPGNFQAEILILIEKGGSPAGEPAEANLSCGGSISGTSRTSGLRPGDALIADEAGDGAFG